MAHPVHPLRTECEQFARDEIARVGIGGLDAVALSKLFVTKGASRTRARAWIEAIRMEASALATPAIIEQRRVEQAAIVAAAALGKVQAQAAAQAAHATARATIQAVETAAATEAATKAAADAATTAELATLLEALPGTDEALDMAATVEAVQRAIEAAPDISIVPDAARALHEHMGLIIANHRKVMAVSLFPDGRMRNARQSIVAGEALRRAVESMAKLYETLNNVAMIETFMRITLAEVAKLSPQTAAAIVVQLRSIQQQWSAPVGGS